jgi:multidrug efflux pump subunit AcrA (membrane-fusion protein)
MSALSDVLQLPPRNRFALPVLNVALSMLVVAGAVGGYFLVGPAKTTTAAPRTATAAKGVVLSSVSASGTAQSPSSIGVNFKASGQIVSVAVKPGQRVAKGQVLGKIDPTSAQLSVRSAQSTLHTAQAQLAQTLAGETPQKRAQDKLTIAQALNGVKASKLTLAQQKQMGAQDQKTLALSVGQAQQQLASDNAQLATDQAQLQKDTAQLNADQAAYNAAAPVVDADKAALASAQATQLSHEQAQADAQGSQSSSNSQLTTDQQTLSTAQSQLTKDQTACAADPTSPSCAAIASDQAAVSSAQSAVDSDRSNVASAQSTLTSLTKTLQSDSAAISAAQSKLSDDTTTLNTAKSAVTSDTANLQSDQKTIAGDQKTVTSSKNALANAKNGQAAGLLKDKQALRNAQTAVGTQQLNAQSTIAGVKVAQAPPQAGTVAQAQASVEQAQINLQTAELALAQTTLRAPVAGTVAAVNGHVGQDSSSVSSSSASSSSSTGSTGSSSSGSGSGFVTLTDLSGMQVVAGFSETDAAKLRVGQAATVTVDALSNEQLAAHVIAIDTNATVSSSVVTYNVTFAIDNAAPRLKPGMSATVNVVTAEEDNVVHVPSTAVTGSGSNARVTVLRNGKQVTVPVVAGVVGDSATAIVSGLNAGEQVVLPSVTISSVGSSSTSTTGATSGAGGGAARFGGGFIPGP